MEGTPPRIDLSLIENRLMELGHVEAVHDLHVWTITSGMDAMSCHLIVSNGAKVDETLKRGHQMMRDEFAITKTTIQIEKPGLHENGVNTETKTMKSGPQPPP